MNGTITKRLKKDGRASWGYVFDAGCDENGKRHQATKSGFATKRQAEDQLRRAIGSFQSPGAVKTSVQFSELFSRWINEHAARRCELKTLERYRELGAYALAKFGGAGLDELTPMRLEKAFSELKDSGGRSTSDHPNGKPLSAKTVANIASVVRVCLKTGVRWGLVPMNPMSTVELPRIVRTEPKVFQPEQLQLFLNAVRESPVYPVVLIASASGARRGEIAALRWQDVDLQTGVVSIARSLEQTRSGLRMKQTKNRRVRKFVLPDIAVTALLKHREEQDRARAMYGADYRIELDLVFCTLDGDYLKPDSLTAKVCLLAKHAGLSGFSLHTFRHTHASQLLSLGVPLPTVSKRLGHSNPQVTLSIYSHAMDADEVAASKIWNDAMVAVISRQAAGMLENVINPNQSKQLSSLKQVS